MKNRPSTSFQGSSSWELVFDFKWHVTSLCSRNSIRKVKAINKNEFYFISFLTGFTASLTEIK